jgi:hypothetical protein
MQDNNDVVPPRFRPVPWTALETPADVELWIAEHNLALQEHVGQHERGYGVCFTLDAGGDLFLQTGEGAIVLDVTPDAAWVTPLIEAVGQVEAPKGRLWLLPDDKLVQLILGLSSLVASTTLVVGHPFGRHRSS